MQFPAPVRFFNGRMKGGMRIRGIFSLILDKGIQGHYYCELSAVCVRLFL